MKLVPISIILESVLDQIFDSSSSLAKEPLQNAIDRITEANLKARAQGKIEISLMEFSGAEKSQLLIPLVGRLYETTLKGSHKMVQRSFLRD